jgi:hypothetical protein
VPRKQLSISTSTKNKLLNLKSDIMKKLLLLVIVLVAVTSCQEKQRYTQKSPEIETYKKAIKDYEMANWESLASHYADTAKVFYNATKKNPKTVAELIEEDKKDVALFETYAFVAEESEYEMVVTDKGETWVNYWGLWQGRLKANNELYELPVHLTAQFVNGKIVKEHGYWNNTEIALAISNLQKVTPPTTEDVKVE